jgi:putative ATP-dependent endonuclease of OLD family
VIAESVKIKGHSCFKNEWTGFDEIKPLNVIIGRNNTGKSRLLDLAEVLCGGSFYKKGWQYSCTGKLDQNALLQQFRQGTSGGDLRYDHWDNHGAHFVDIPMSWEVDAQGKITIPAFPSPIYQRPYADVSNNEGRFKRLAAIAGAASHKLAGKQFRRLLADRDMRPERPEGAFGTSSLLSPDGAGATNIIRRYIHSAHLQRELIQTDLLMALNEICGRDGTFTEIESRHFENAGTWEVFLGEKKKDLIPLSQSGSGLKTVVLVLLNLLVVPKIDDKPKSDYVFAFEELENNLHPSLLRRLFKYLEGYVVREKATVFLTTHASVALDTFGMSENAQIIHVTHNGESARAETVPAHFDRLGVINDIGAKPSDLLQANGIVWVEGPSDRIYINRWIDIFSGGKFREGRDYQCAFFGGALLARAKFAAPEKPETELVNLLCVNPNIMVVCDGDRTAESGEGSALKNRVLRIQGEVEKIHGAHIWITEAKEIENYLPGAVLAAAIGADNLLDPGQYEHFFPRENVGEKQSYLESHLKRKTYDKVELAVQSAPHMTKELMKPRFDLGRQMEQIIAAIQRWNE